MKIDNDLILPTITVILTLVITIGYTTLVPVSTVDQLLDENSALFSEVSQANHEISVLTKELESYKTTSESLIKLGASPEQAKCVIKAAEVHAISPKF